MRWTFFNWSAIGFIPSSLFNPPTWYKIKKHEYCNDLQHLCFVRKQSETGCWCKRTCQRRIPLSEQSHPQFLFSGRAFDCRLHSAFPIRQVQLLQRQADLLTFCYNFNIFEPSESQQWILPVAIVTYVAFWLCENYNTLCRERQGKAPCSDCQ